MRSRLLLPLALAAWLPAACTQPPTDGRSLRAMRPELSAAAGDSVWVATMNGRELWVRVSAAAPAVASRDSAGRAALARRLAAVALARYALADSITKVSVTLEARGRWRAIGWSRATEKYEWPAAALRKDEVPPRPDRTPRAASAPPAV